MITSFVSNALRRMACALSACLVITTAVAAEYPARAVRIVVGAVAGGGVDITGRVVAAKLSEQLGQQFFVDNRPGAGGNVGSEFVGAEASRPAPREHDRGQTRHRRGGDPVAE